MFLLSFSWSGLNGFWLDDAPPVVIVSERGVNACVSGEWSGWVCEEWVSVRVIHSAIDWLIDGFIHSLRISAKTTQNSFEQLAIRSPYHDTCGRCPSPSCSSGHFSRRRRSWRWPCPLWSSTIPLTVTFIFIPRVRGRLCCCFRQFLGLSLQCCYTCITLYREECVTVTS